MAASKMSIVAIAKREQNVRRKSLAAYKRPARYVVLPVLPASPTGKILRQRLSELAQEFK